MTVQLNLPPDLVERLTEEARQKGLSLDAYLLQTILHKAPNGAPLADDATNRHESTLTAEERVQAIDEFFAEVDRDPPSGVEPLPEEALSRRNLYDDRRNRL